jgi:hypothetical protein
MDEVVDAMLERFKTSYVSWGNLDDFLPEWEETLRPILEETYAKGWAARGES